MYIIRIISFIFNVTNKKQYIFRDIIFFSFIRSSLFNLVPVYVLALFNMIRVRGFGKLTRILKNCSIKLLKRLKEPTKRKRIKPRELFNSTSYIF